MQVDGDYIEELFADRLGVMEADPPDDGWIRVECELDRRSQMAKKYWLAAASFALILGASATMFFLQNNLLTNEGIAENNSPQMEEQIADQVRDDEIMLASNGDEIIQVGNDEIIRANNDGNDFVELVNSVAEQVHNDEIMHANNDEIIFASNDDIDFVELVNSVSEIINVTELPDETPQIQTVARENTTISSNIVPFRGFTFFDDFDDDALPKNNRWSVSGQFAPMHSYRTISSVPTGLRKSDFDNAESPLLAYSGGISVAFSVFQRLSIQTGVFYSQMGQSINNVTPVTDMYAAVSSTQPYTRNFVRTSSGSVSVVSNLKSDENSTYSTFFNAESQPSSSSSTVSNPVKYQLMERVDYLEIPLTLRYKIVDRKLNFYVLGGMSANVLLETNVFVDNGAELLKSGSILMARPVNYSSTLGLGLGYNIFENLSVGFEPVFKYYMQSYTTSSQVGSNPYALGVFTNAVYRF